MSLRSWFDHGVLRTAFGPRAEPQRLGDMRFCVLDIDVTGTSVRRDSLSGIAVLPVLAGAFRISDLVYYARASAPEPSAERDAEWRSKLLALGDSVAGSPIVTYNPRFVRQMISRVCSDCDLPALDGGWIDLASAAGEMGGENNELTSMDHWLATMEAGGRWPHDACYDVFAMAQLLQAILAYSEVAGIDTVESLDRSQKARAWLRGG